MEDLTEFAKQLEELFIERFGRRPMMVIVFTLPPDCDRAHWVTNVTRTDGIRIVEETAEQMKKEIQ